MLLQLWGHNEYKDVLSKNRFFRNSMNRIQYRDYMKSKKNYCFVLMTKYIFKTIDMMD